MTSPKPIAGGQDAVLAAYQASTQVPVTAPSAQAALSWPYPTFGTPGQIVETREVADLDTVFYRFANGVRLTVKPTKFKADEVMIRVNIGAGRTGLSKTRTSPAWSTGAFIEGGLAKITAEDMEQVLAKRLYGARLAVADDALVLSGETRPADLDVELQVLAAYVADPGWRPEAFQRLKASVKTLHDQYEATDGGVMARDVQGLIHNGDPRWAFPTRQELAEVTLPDLKSLITPDLATGALDIVIIGDISPEKAADLVAQTFAALPPRSPTPAPSAAQREVKFPAPTAAPLTRTHKGRADQATAYLAWPTPDFYANPQAARDDAVMAAVLQLRLIDELREKQGATYSPQVASNHSLVWPGWGVLAVTLEVPPAKLAGVAADIQRIAADLRDHPPTADELMRAKKPRLDNLIKARETNAYWLSELSGADADPRRLDNIRAILPGTERVTAQDVQAAARRILRPETLWRLEVRPEGQ